jgi:26S proteasome regulatory subunit N2
MIPSSPQSFDSLRGFLSLLSPQTVHESIVQVLSIINEQIETFWFEVSDYASTLEALATNTSFPHHKLASLILSKLYFYLSDPALSVKFALLAGELLEKEPDCSEFKQAVITKVVDTYLASRKSAGEDNGKDDSPITVFFTKLVQYSILKGDLVNAIAISLEAARLDLVQSIIDQCSSDILCLFIEFIEILELRPEFRASVLYHVAQKEMSSSNPNFDLVFKCYLNDAHLGELLSFISRLVNSDQAIQGMQMAVDLGKSGRYNEQLEASAELNLSFPLDYKFFTSLRLKFLSNRNHSDMLILDRTKTFLSANFSMHHQSLTFANALMQAGTTCDELLRADLTWFGQASNWAKFSAVSSLGVIHQGQDNPLALLESFLPKEGISASEYAEGGALYALGLISPMSNTNLSEKDPSDPVWDLLLKNVTSSKSEVAQHGACLGLGLLSMGRGPGEEIEALKTVLYSDTAVSGEAAALAIGLLFYGGNYDIDVLDEIVEYSKDTQHEKISRGIAFAVALSYAETRDGLDTSYHLLQRMLRNQNDPVQRYGGAWGIALSYAGTGNRIALDVLLKLSVADTSDDVRRAAVTGLGFVLYNSEELVEILKLLLISYNPHIRYGAALALGIAFPASGRSDLINMLKPLSRDLIDFVRQAALLAMSMILQQQSESATKELRKALEASIQTKHEDAMAKFGAVLSQGILDAGGRNCVFTMKDVVGKRPVAGLALFTQFWYWYPLIHMASLALVPSSFLCVSLNESGEIAYPDVTGTLACKPSLSAYPAPLKPLETSAATKELTSVVLSTSKKRTKSSGATSEPKKNEESADKQEEAPVSPVQSQMAVEEPETHSVRNFERVPFWLSGMFSCPLLKRRFDPFGINIIKADGQVITFDEAQKESFALPQQKSPQQSLQKHSSKKSDKSSTSAGGKKQPKSRQ